MSDLNGDELLKEFSGNLRRPLVEFFNELPKIECDAMIFMARKALRLYDLFVGYGFPMVHVPIFSHHIIDQDISFLRGKRVALVDDSLIVGSTLRRVQEELLDRGVQEVVIAAFCKDSHWSQADLVEPDHLFAEIPSNEMLTFCSNEVSAFARNGVPYLSDFPMSLRKRVNSADFESLLGSIYWTAHTISRDQEASTSSNAHTFLPNDQVFDRIVERYGIDLRDVSEIAKVRMFSFGHPNGFYYCKFVPLVTFRPFHDKDVEKIFEHFSCVFSLPVEVHKTLRSTTSKLRFFQHLVSELLYRIFHEDMEDRVGKNKMPSLDFEETARHFVGQTTRFLLEIQSDDQKAEKFRTFVESVGEITVGEVPRNRASKATAEVMKSLSLVHHDHNGGHPDSRFFYSDMLLVFVDFFNRIEVPVRESILKNFLSGIRDLSKVHGLNRLKIGVTWTALLDGVTGQHCGWQARQLLSVYLDNLVDLGIAVPALSKEGGVTYRIYRHGEDVLFGEAQFALCGSAATAYLNSSGRTLIPKIEAEKLFVLMVRLGAALNYLDEVQGVDDDKTFARVGYHLHGAVVHMDPVRDGNYAGSINNWLSHRLIQRGILIQRKGGYEVGEIPNAAFASKQSYVFGSQLGEVIGRLRTKGSPAISERDLIVLSSALGPLNTLGAISAELRIFSARVKDELVIPLQSFDWKDVDAFEALLSEVSFGFATEALNSARMKYVSNSRETYDSIPQKGSNYFLETGNGLANGLWEQYTSALSDLRPGGSDTEVERQLQRSGRIVFDLLACVYAAELALISGVEFLPEKRKITLVERVCTKIQKFYRDLTELDLPVSSIANFHQRLAEVTEEKRSVERFKDMMAHSLQIVLQETPDAKNLSIIAERTSFGVGRRENLITYVSFLWFDIVNSKGAKCTSEEETVVQRDRAKRLKIAVNDYLNKIVGDAVNKKCTIRERHGLPNQEDGQGDDGQQLFFAGPASRHFANTILKKLIELAHLHGVQIRAVLLPADFVCPAPQSLKGSARIDSLDFFESYASMTEEIEREGDQLMLDDPSSSIVWVGGNYYSSGFDFDDAVVSQVQDQKIFEATTSGNPRPVPFSAFLVKLQ